MCLCVTLIHHCPIVNRFSVAALKKKHMHSFKKIICLVFVMVGMERYSFVLIKVVEFMGKGYLWVLKISSSKQFQISKLLTDDQSLDTVIHQQFLKGSTEY